ncbi:hypothetical protein DES45_101919 [Microvirga subterranea]|uniref:Uncharacterized protein n=1 Tax=Microvirga subterranea TaxID=186651 RepID=A0A370HVY1_9HYPH|nr:hypothetical protein DES45_101919 [Microvirga subterranea]
MPRQPATRLCFLWHAVDLRNRPVFRSGGSFLSFVARILYRQRGIDKG